MTSRTDHMVSSEPGIEIFVREVTAQETSGAPVLLVHGGGPGGLASFDLPIPGYSVAEDIASAEHAVYIMDIRGWGRSTRPAQLDQPLHANPPAVSSEEAVRDISAVVDWIQERRTGERVALIGWATGGHWCGMYAARCPDRVSLLVLLNSLYGVAAPWGLQRAFEDPDHPGEPSRSLGAFRTLTQDNIVSSWDRAIPTEDKTEWREPEVTIAFQDAVVGDSDGEVRVPSGFQLESYLMARGFRYWDARDIRLPTLVIRGDLDHWSRPADLIALQQEIVNAPKVTTLTIPGGTHYLFLDRPERGRDQFLREVTTFLASPLLDRPSSTEAVQHSNGFEGGLLPYS